MKKYEAPEFNVIELDATDVIQTSGNLNLGGDAQIGGTGVYAPIPGQTSTTSLDDNYNNN